MSWFRGMGADAPPPPQRSLTIPRLINTLLNPFAQSGQAANFQKDVYLYGDGGIYGIKNGMPTWVYCDFLPLGPSKTGRTKINIPDSFTLLAFLASSSSIVRGGFRVNVYDVNRRRRLTERPANFNTMAGTGSSPMFMGGSRSSRMSADPYRFKDSNAQAMITIVNLETVNNNIEFILYGVQGGSYQ
jgi:hypothetical protein